MLTEPKIPDLAVLKKKENVKIVDAESALLCELKRTMAVEDIFFLYWIFSVDRF